MTSVQIADESGKTVTYIQLEDGRLMPSFDPEILKNVSSLKLREDDILICAFPKSGTHWLFEICRMLLLKTTDVPVIAKDDTMIEFKSQNILDEAPSPRVLNSHYRYGDLPTDLKTKRPKIIYVRRNPKDIAVSLYNHTKKLRKYYKYDGEFKDFLKLFVDGKVDYGSWFEYVKEWELVCENNDLSILELSYEDIKHEPIRQIQKISDFMGLERDEEIITKINEYCSFASMMKRKGHLTGTVDGQSIMYRKGEIGDWKNWFTVSQDEWFNTKYEQNMKDSKLDFVYEH